MCNQSWELVSIPSVSLCSHLQQSPSFHLSHLPAPPLGQGSSSWNPLCLEAPPGWSLQGGPSLTKGTPSFTSSSESTSSEKTPMNFHSAEMHVFLQLHGGIIYIPHNSSIISGEDFQWMHSDAQPVPQCSLRTSPSPTSNTALPANPHFHPQPWATTNLLSLPIIRPFLEESYKWNCTICVLLYLASFTQHSVSEPAGYF